MIDLTREGFTLTKENYFSTEAERLYWGSTSFKNFDMEHTGMDVFGNFVEGACQAREMAIRNGEWEKEEREAFLVGQYVHAYFEGAEAFQQFCSDNYSAIYTKGKTPKPRAAFARADLMIDTLKNSKLVTDMSNCEHEVPMIGQIDGVWFKIMVDLLDVERGYFADYKTTASLSKVYRKNGKNMTFIDAYDYKLQTALYEEIVYQNTGKHMDCYIVVVDKNPQPDHEIIYMGNRNNHAYFEHKRDEITIKIADLHAVKHGESDPEACGKCKYCISTKELKRPVTLEEYSERLGI